MPQGRGIGDRDPVVPTKACEPRAQPKGGVPPWSGEEICHSKGRLHIPRGRGRPVCSQSPPWISLHCCHLSRPSYSILLCLRWSPLSSSTKGHYLPWGDLFGEDAMKEARDTTTKMFVYDASYNDTCKKMSLSNYD